MDDILSLLIPIVLAVCVVAAIKIVEDARLRRRLAETHVSEDFVKVLLNSETASQRRAALKWGIVLVMLAVAFALIALFGLGSEDPASYALLFGAAGLAMLLFRKLASADG